MRSSSSSGSGSDRYEAAATDMAHHVSGKVLAALRQPEYNAQIVALLDPVVNHVISRVFPYIILSCTLFLILLALTVLTFLMVMRGSGGVWTPPPLSSMLMPTAPAAAAAGGGP